MARESTSSSISGRNEFTKDEFAAFEKVRSVALACCEEKTAGRKHRMLLGLASELVDAAADLAAVETPGVRVVALGLLAEHISQLALDIENETDTD